MKQQTSLNHPTTTTRQGFTIIEVMLVLAITGLMLIGVLGGTYSAIATQRYQDSVRSFSEFLRQLYSEVISPESLGEGNSNQYAIYGKVAVFGLDQGNNVDHNIYTATLIGDVKIPSSSPGNNFINELSQVNAKLFCGDTTRDQESTRSVYTPLWDAKILYPNKQQMRGTLIIARSPTSGTVHTAFTSKTFDVKDSCEPDRQGASTALQTALHNEPAEFSTLADIDFCLRSENSNIIRDVRLRADGRNTSAVNILDADSGDSKCR